MTHAPRKLLSRSQRHAAILQGAATAFATKGFASTAMEEVAAASGITKEIVYRHFASKEELYRAVLEGATQRTREEWQAFASEHDCCLVPASAPCSPSVGRSLTLSVCCWCTRPASPSLLTMRTMSAAVSSTGCCSVADTTIRSSTAGRLRWRCRMSGMLSSPGLTSVTQPAMRSLHGAVSLVSMPCGKPGMHL